MAVSFPQIMLLFFVYAVIGLVMGDGLLFFKS